MYSYLSGYILLNNYKPLISDHGLFFYAVLFIRLYFFEYTTLFMNFPINELNLDSSLPLDDSPSAFILM